MVDPGVASVVVVVLVVVVVVPWSTATVTATDELPASELTVTVALVGTFRANRRCWAVTVAVVASPGPRVPPVAATVTESSEVAALQERSRPPVLRSVIAPEGAWGVSVSCAGATARRAGAGVCVPGVVDTVAGATAATVAVEGMMAAPAVLVVGSVEVAPGALVGLVKGAAAGGAAAGRGSASCEL